MTYQRIEPFPATSQFDFPELRALSSIWREKKSELEETGAFKEFIQKLKREWAIETGIIERLYLWDRGVTEALIEQGIEASIIAHAGGIPRDEAEHITDVIHDHLDIVEGLFSYIKGEEQITEHFIRELQARFTAHQETTEGMTSSGILIKISLKKGEYKTLPNNPRRKDGSIHDYCPPEFTKDEMERLVSLFRSAEDDYTPEVKAAWLHHRFTQIHPFQDGNGRVARALTSLIFLKADLLPLVIRESDREEYIGALEAADQGDLTSLVTLFASRQREAILKVIGLEQQVQQSRYAGQIISSALDILKARFSKEKEKTLQLLEYAKNLLRISEERMEELANGLNEELMKVTPRGEETYGAWMNSADNDRLDRRHYFQKQIVEIANQFGYFANLERYRAWVRMSILTKERFDIVLSIHGYGYRDTGLLAASAFTYIRAASEDGPSEAVSLHPSATDLFQFNSIEPSESIERRFRDWLESSLAIGLAEWKKLL